MFLFVKRYLFAKKSHSVVNIITSLSLVSIAVPVAAVIFLLSIFNGFGELLESTNRVVDPDISITRREGKLFDVGAIDTAALRLVEGVEALSFTLEQSMLLEHKGVQSVALLRGVDSSYLDVVPLDGSMFRGDYRVELGELDRVVIGRSMAYKLGINSMIDTFIDVYALKQNSFSSLLPMSNYNTRKIRLSSLYSADMQSEERYAITSLRAVQQMISAEGRASALFVRLSGSAREQAEAQEKIKETIGEEYTARNRREMNPMVYDIVEYEKWGLLFISILIMALASFTLIGALSMLIIEKRDDISTLRAMGGSWRFIRQIFFGEGLFISCVGIALGAVIGSALTLAQQWYGFIRLPAQTLVLTHYPVRLMASDVLLVAAMSLTISLILSYIVVNQMIKKR